MAAGKFDIAIEQGATYTKTFVWQSNGSPVNNTGWIARMSIKAQLSDSVSLVDLTTTNGRIVLGGANGQITLGFTAVETAAFTWTSGIYDLEMVSPSGAVTRLLKGNVTVDLEVTKI